MSSVLLKRFAPIVGAAVVLIPSAYMLAIRPWHLTWGATEVEVGRSMPGDDVVPHPSFNATRAVTVEALPEEIWPWIVQMGYRRAGFYSYDRLDNHGIPSAEEIVADLQNISVGDEIPLTKSSYVRVVSLEPNQSMVWTHQPDDDPPAFSWTWGLYREAGARTRLVTRLRVSYDWNAGPILPTLAFDVFELIMMRKCMLGIKRRAEALQRRSTS